jgi:hypothetical protein
MQVEEDDDIYALEPNYNIGSWSAHVDETLHSKVVPPGESFVDPTTTHPQGDTTTDWMALAKQQQQLNDDVWMKPLVFPQVAQQQQQQQQQLVLCS